MIAALDHINIETLDLERSVTFYRDVLGLEVGFRPNFGVPGAWLYAADAPLIHLVVRDAVNAGPTGAIHHIALKAKGCGEWQARLSALVIAYDIMAVPDLGVTQLFITDPNGVRLELNFYDETE